MSISFRDAVVADAAAIDRVYRESFRDTFAHLYRVEDLESFFAAFTPDAWAAELASPHYAFRLAEADGSVVGYVKLGPAALPVRPRGRPIELRQFYILSAWHGRGIAKHLMDWALAQARCRLCDEMYLTVFVDNHRARRFYERYGFEDVGPYAFMVGDHADEDIIMRLAL